jgi:hypothetical protein
VVCDLSVPPARRSISFFLCVCSASHISVKEREKGEREREKLY